jgi:uncharacterized protein YaaN involved in tellurite resistance
MRSRDLSELSDVLRQAGDVVKSLEPAMLTPTGMASMFGGRARRLAWFRGRYEAAARTLDAITNDLRTRATQVERKGQSLNHLHEQARAFILELDAHLEAGKTRSAEVLSHGSDAAGEIADRLGARLGSLEDLRARAVQQLPLVRMVQNIDAPVSETVEHAAAAITTWKADWADRLGMHLDQRAKMRPDEGGLDQTKADLLKALDGANATLADARSRRGEAEREMTTTQTVTPNAA